MFQIVRDIVRIRRVSLDVFNLKEARRNAGHSKWSNIKHIKAAKDAQKSIIFKKMTRLIRLAIQGKYSCKTLLEINLSILHSFLWGRGLVKVYSTLVLTY
jgi:hypothetical protein